MIRHDEDCVLSPDHSGHCYPHPLVVPLRISAPPAPEPLDLCPYCGRPEDGVHGDHRVRRPIPPPAPEPPAAAVWAWGAIEDELVECRRREYDDPSWERYIGGVMKRLWEAATPPPLDAVRAAVEAIPLGPTGRSVWNSGAESMRMAVLREVDRLAGDHKTGEPQP